jgi:hypothetical protein
MRVGRNHKYVRLMFLNKTQNVNWPAGQVATSPADQIKNSPEVKCSRPAFVV